MPAYVIEVNDHHGDLTDILYYCASCAPAHVDPWPGHSWPDYDVYCDKCGDLLHTNKEER